MCTLTLSAGGEGLNLLPNFQKEGFWQDLNFEREVGGIEGGNFFQGELQFLQKKNKLKFEIFNDKKKFINKNIFLCHN